MRFLLAAFAALFSFHVPATAQTWSPAYPFDTGWHRANPTENMPILQEPQEWSPKILLPGAPDGTDLVRTRITQIEYRTTISCTNVGPEPASYSGAGSFQYRLGHVPGLYRGPDDAIYATGHGWTWQFDEVVWIGSMGGGSFFRTVQPSPLDAEGCPIPDVRTYTTTGLSSQAHIDPITPEWLAVTRRGAHALWDTTTGGYSWHWAWQDGTPPPGWGSHSPLTYSAVEETRILGTIAYGDLPPGP